MCLRHPNWEGVCTVTGDRSLIPSASIEGSHDGEEPLVCLSLAVLVPVYNEQYLVRASLQRLLVLNQSPLLNRIKVIVVDDCSSDGTAGVLEQYERMVREE